MSEQEGMVEGMTKIAEGAARSGAFDQSWSADASLNQPTGAARDESSPRAVPAGASRESLKIAAYLVAAYFAANLFLVRYLSPDLSFYVLQPLMWCGLGYIAFKAWIQLDERPSLSRPVIVLGVLAGLFQIALMLIAGVLYGLGHSPYARQPLHIAENLWYLTTMIVALELARAYLITVWARVSPMLALLAVTLLFAAATVSTTQFQMVIEGHRRFDLIGQNLLPELGQSLLATSIAAMAGPLPAIAYRGTVNVFEWVSPVLPNLSWAEMALFGTLAPVLAMVLIRESLVRWQESPEAEEEVQEPAEQGVGLGWALVLAVVVGVIWLNTGLLGVRTSLISGHSMDPYLSVGDMAVTKSVSPDSVKVGDVIQFRLGGGAVLHRVVDIQEKGGSRVFITRGDNNNTEDKNPVVERAVIGKVVLKIPEAGWVPIRVHDAVSKLKELL